MRYRRNARRTESKAAFEIRESALLFKFEVARERACRGDDVRDHRCPFQPESDCTCHAARHFGGTYRDGCGLAQDYGLYAIVVIKICMHGRDGDVVCWAHARKLPCELSLLRSEAALTCKIVLRGAWPLFPD